VLAYLTQLRGKMPFTQTAGNQIDLTRLPASYVILLEV
jgi:hypothetical protein